MMKFSWSMRKQKVRQGKYVHFITSQPYGATVKENGDFLGETPLYISSTGSHRLISLNKDGYQSTTMPLDHDVRVSLQPNAGTMTGGGETSPYLSINRTKSALPIYLTTAASVLAGATAAYFKIKADDAYGDYRQNGDQASLDRVHRDDTLAGVSLVLCEVNILALTYFLFSH